MLHPWPPKKATIIVSTRTPKGLVWTKITSQYQWRRISFCIDPCGKLHLTIFSCGSEWCAYIGIVEGSGWSDITIHDPGGKSHSTFAHAFCAFHLHILDCSLKRYFGLFWLGLEGEGIYNDYRMLKCDRMNFWKILFWPLSIALGMIIIEGWWVGRKLLAWNGLG